MKKAIRRDLPVLLLIVLTSALICVVCAAPLVYVVFGLYEASEPEAPFPSRWVSIADVEGSVTMRPDGTASLVNVPVVPTGSACVEENAVLVTEDTTYRVVGEAQYLISTSVGELFSGPDTQGLWSLNWSKFMIDSCGTNERDSRVQYAYGMDGESWDRYYSDE